MWKMGPACAAQHAKYVRARAANCGVRNAWATVSSRPPATAEDAAEEQDGAWAEPIGERAPDERSDAHAEEVEERGGRDPRPGPPGRGGHGLEKDPEREHRPEPDAGHDDAGTDDDPAVEELHRLRPRPRCAPPDRRADRRGTSAASDRRRRTPREPPLPAGSAPARQPRPPA